MTTFAVNELFSIRNALDVATCDGDVSGVMAISSVVDAAIAEIEKVRSVSNDIADGVADIDVSSYEKYDDNINLYGPIVVGTAMLLPLFMVAIFWPLGEQKKVPSGVAKSAAGSAIFATVLLAILSTGLLPTIIAFSDGCTDADAVVKRTVGQPAFDFYIDCDPTQDGIYEPFQVDINASIANVTTANEQLIALNATCPEANLTVYADQMTVTMDTLVEGANDLLVCSRPQGVYTTAKQTACGDDVYMVVLHLHQAFFGTHLSPSLSQAFRRPNNAHRRIRLRPFLLDARHYHEKRRGRRERN